LTTTPTASAVSSDLADRLRDEAFVICDVRISGSSVTRQLSWESLAISEDQRSQLVGRMGATPPRVTPNKEMQKAGTRIKSAVEAFQRRHCIKSDPFKLYPQSKEEGVATALLAIAEMADRERAAVIAGAAAARNAWYVEVDELVAKAGIEDVVAARNHLRDYFPSDERLARSLRVSWTLKLVASLEVQAEASLSLRETTARERLHRESEQSIRQAIQGVAESAAEEASQLIAEALDSLQSGAVGKPMNGQRREKLLGITDRVENLAACFQGSGGLLDVANQLRTILRGLRRFDQGSAGWDEQISGLRQLINAEIKSLNDPTKRGHRSIAEFIK
jgi:hypothetical protein